MVPVRYLQGRDQASEGHGQVLLRRPASQPNLTQPDRGEERLLVTRRVGDDERLSAWRDLQWATSLIMSRFAHELAEEGLTLEEFDVVVHLAWARDGVLPLRSLVASMVSGYQLSRSGLTRLLDRMERDGLVERTLSRDDRRQFDVAITDQGRDVFDRVWPGHLQGIQRSFSEPLTDHDVTVLKRVLAKLIRANEEPNGRRPAVGS